MTLRQTGIDSVDMIILPPVRDLGDGFQVRRALPSAHRRMVGPFVFFDQFGPTTFSAGEGLDVRPHPHIGLATVTYVLEGEILHRDSLGKVQPVRPGAVNWMTAGRGIVHSERSADDTRAAGGPLFGLQTWVALPQAKEEVDPAFFHHPADTIPETEAEGVRIRVVAGSSDGLTSPVQAFSDMLYADVTLQDGARYRLGTDHIERAVYVISGGLAVEGQSGGFNAGELVIFKPDSEIVLRANGPTRIMLVGGEPLDGPRHIYWNFVSSSRDRIEQAKDDWRQGRFDTVPGEREFIPLPD
ncbi:pirin family protein [Sphingobium sp. B12D2B]|uniref:pirin family protein n=1 Tax=Sphingobium sp. B12D2B TaxID=2940577 RepID=UPI002224CD84|nr:pirin family protein [Sphingobium sp. B12D2B]MCW2348995.1 redox-sensitive bicupin YhaK (pirin superfamily) [Sphingobium sp. B12D2B]